MATKRTYNVNSLQTILTFDNVDDNLSDWSVVWSTTHVPGMDTATGGGSRRRKAGRRSLRVAAFAFCGLLTMQCRVIAAALTGGFFVFVLMLVPAVALIGNPLRHFEVYLGQWSISGPGRAFRIIPMLDGIGVAICINAIVRAICSCTIAAIAGLYVWHSICDDRLPFTYCRDFDMNPYEPVLKDTAALRMSKVRAVPEIDLPAHTTELADYNSENYTYRRDNDGGPNIIYLRTRRQIYVCKETYTGDYPAVYNTPSYNFFYVEVMKLQADYSWNKFNLPLCLSILAVWAAIWAVIIYERISHGRVIWNNMYPWFVVIPCLWSAILMVMSVTNFIAKKKSLRKIFRIESKDVFQGASDALEVAMYIHAASLGSEMILGKGLNHYAFGHIDPKLNNENVWHSVLLLLLTTFNSGGAAVCALVASAYPDIRGFSNVKQSAMWTIPLFSNCASFGNYSHFTSTLLFSGLCFSYITTAFILMKTALHTIFEYRVKLVFYEQGIVGALIISCTAMSMLFATSGGLALLESIDMIMSGISTPFVCLLELVGLLHVYGSRDFISDMNIATEDNSCSIRIGYQWQSLPFLVGIALILKIVMLVNAQMALMFMLLASLPLAGVVLAVPLRAAHNAYVFLHPAPRREL